MIWEALDSSLIAIGLEADDYKDVMKNLGSVLIKEGYAKESYVNALIAREDEFPTGLDVDGVGVAIPHTSVDHVNKVGIAIATLDKPVTFVQMGTDDETVGVQLVFMLAVVDPNAHIDQLQRIIEIIQDKAVLTSLMEAKKADEIIDIVREKEAALRNSK